MEKKPILAAQEFSTERFTKRVLFQKGGSVVFILNFMPGQSLPVHAHPGTEVFITVLEGSGTMQVDGQDTAVEQGDIVHCGGQEQFAFTNSSQANVSLHVVLTKTPSEEYAKNI
ncbi:cupin domain-containing protein [Paenibacillus sambharensis]|uniref:Cupin domain-containing protein n=1 Tax=Paenibacillus sambharensis TaxID=1803190 RepID=A0A2W1LRI3_9BACL|nr:cupin domain-containing protein [Paenibacillus sambharensis]PZD97582.1 cupin domain-containing protein [Paenibacillus sambharensis]